MTRRNTEIWADEHLPGVLSERVTARNARGIGDGPVVYWMRAAARGHENPALDTALTAAQALGRRILVYHAVTERLPWASDRLHTFILQGARDVSEELRARGVPYAFHLERPGHRDRVLERLASEAGLVVTDELPISPLRGWLRTLAEHAPCAVWSVDASCVVPMRLSGRAHGRAFAFRDATAAARAERVSRDWSEVEWRGASDLPRLPFEPVDLARADIPALVAACAIDHGIAPVAHTRGGSRAGYARWESFLRGPIRAYAATRNDPARDGTSGMSPYLHFGHVSPLRLARDAAAIGGAGAGKWLDELLTWRELAWHACFWDPRMDGVDALPEWARGTLARHRAGGTADGSTAQTDAYRNMSWETLARGVTGQPLWDVAQSYLRVHGELHNNLRMTWGKAIAQWTPDAEAALDLTIDLNHRFALDGRDPASQAGILWCFGWADRPFPPERAVLGLVRPRPLEEQAARIDLNAVAKAARTPALARAPGRVAVIGAGLAGLMCARTLVDHGVPVCVFDKARGPGGRTSTRRETLDERTVWFDHGAPVLHLPVVQHDTPMRSASRQDERALARHVRAWVQDGVLTPHTARRVRFHDGVRSAVDTANSPSAGVLGSAAFVGGSARPDGRPGGGVNLLARHLAAGLGSIGETRYGQRVVGLARGADGWSLELEDGTRAGPFDAVLLSIPAPQVVELLERSGDTAPTQAACVERLRSVAARPELVAMAWLDTQGDAGWDEATFDDPDLYAAHRVTAADGVAFTLRGSDAFTRTNLEQDPQESADRLLQVLRRHVADLRDAPVRLLRGHRWRYARVDPLGADCWFDGSARLGACGDAFLGGDAAGALRSGVALAGRLLGELARPEARRPWTSTLGPGLFD